MLATGAERARKAVRAPHHLAPAGEGRAEWNLRHGRALARGAREGHLELGMILDDLISGMRFRRSQAESMHPCNRNDHTTDIIHDLN